MVPKIRKDNTFKHNWAIRWNGDPEDFSDATDINLTAIVIGQYKKLERGTHYRIDGNIIKIDCTPSICNRTGVYKLELKYKKPNSDFIDGQRRSAVDLNAFEIVPDSAQANVTQDISTTSDAIVGFNGKNSFQVWKETHEGDISDYEAWLRQPAMDAAKEVTEAVGQFLTEKATEISDVLSPIQEAETARVNAEGDATNGRVKAENERVAAEEARVNAEGDATKGRVKAENDRVKAEQAREAAEEGRAAELATKANHGYDEDETPKSVKELDTEIGQLAGEVSQTVKKTDSKIYIGAVQTELDWMYNGSNRSAQLGAVLSDGRFICAFGGLTAFNDVMGISWQRTDIGSTSTPYERDGYIYVADATQLYKLTLEGIDVKTYPIANINSVAVAPNGTIAVGIGAAVGEKTVIYMDNDGLEIWSNTEVASCAAVDIDSSGNVLAGYYANQAGDGLRIYDSAGMKQQQIGRGYVVDAKFDHDDNVIVLATVSSGGIYKYDKSLKQLWYSSGVVSSFNSRTRLSIGDDNTIYTPSYSGTAGVIDCYRFKADGDLIYKFASGGAARASSLVSDNNGYVYLTCILNSNNTLLRFKEYNKVRIW